MPAILNRQLFATQSFDSGALGVLGSVVHQFQEPGRYLAVVRQNDKVKESVAFEVSDSSENLQLDIDLAAVRSRGMPKTDDCTCAETRKTPHAMNARAPVPTVSPKGYVLFYVSSGEGGYSVRAGKVGEDKAAFDSTELDNGDLFALSLLAPTRYSMANVLGKAKGLISVTLKREAARMLSALEAIYVEAACNEFSPNEVKLLSGQGLVFRIREKSRIVIKQLEPAKDEDVPGSRRRFVARRPPARQPPAKR